MLDLRRILKVGQSTRYKGNQQLQMSLSPEVLLRPRAGWQSVDLDEIWHRRELFLFLIWRDIKIRYKQTLFGGLWAVFQPLLAMAIFTVVFGRLAGIQTDGPPYPLF